HSWCPREIPRLVVAYWVQRTPRVLLWCRSPANADGIGTYPPPSALRFRWWDLHWDESPTCLGDYVDTLSGDLTARQWLNPQQQSPSQSQSQSSQSSKASTHRARVLSNPVTPDSRYVFAVVGVDETASLNNSGSGSGNKDSKANASVPL